MTMIGWLLYLVVAAICAGIAEYLVPGRIPGGALTTIVFGFAGARLGLFLMGPLGPTLAGVSVFPAIAGSTFLVFAMTALSINLRQRQTKSERQAILEKPGPG